MAISTLRIATAGGKRKPKVIRFSKRAIEQITPPLTGRLILYDAKTPGLQIMVTHTGARTFYLYRWIASRPGRVRIGAFPATTVEQARREAGRLNGQIAEGRDPQTERRTARAEITFGELFDRYLELHSKPHKRTWAEDERRFDLHLSRWKSRQLTKISRPDVKMLHTRIGKTAPYEANRVLGMVRALFNFARNTLDVKIDNPGAGVRRFQENERERFLDAAELKRLVAALNAEETDLDIRDAVLLLLLTGARKGNVLAMRWDAVHLDAATWTIPGSEHKNRRQITLPLMPDAVAILRRRRESLPDAEYVFPSTRGDTGHLCDIKKGWAQACKRAKLADVRMHDLRRTFGSWQAAAGVSMQIIGRSLGHKDGSPATKVYSRLNLDPVRDAVATATAAMLDAVNGDDEGGDHGGT